MESCWATRGGRCRMPHSNSLLEKLLQPRRVSILSVQVAGAKTATASGCFHVWGLCPPEPARAPRSATAATSTMGSIRGSPSSRPTREPSSTSTGAAPAGTPPPLRAEARPEVLEDERGLQDQLLDVTPARSAQRTQCPAPATVRYSLPDSRTALPPEGEWTREGRLGIPLRWPCWSCQQLTDG